MKKIIIAEDEPNLIEMYKLYFERAGYEVFIAENGNQCIELAKSEKPDLILLDIIMPKMDGWQTLTTLKGDPETKQIPILVFSNLGQTQEIQKGLDLGADDYVVKSDMTPKELLEKVEQMIQ
jgi:two-component system phosphate regulon response regulator PhoB/two-component system alkaline phosphatase synthesis response regulator PhoP